MIIAVVVLSMLALLLFLYGWSEARRSSAIIRDYGRLQGRLYDLEHKDEEWPLGMAASTVLDTFTTGLPEVYATGDDFVRAAMREEHHASSLDKD